MSGNTSGEPFPLAVAFASASRHTSQPMKYQGSLVVSAFWVLGDDFLCV